MKDNNSRRQFLQLLSITAPSLLVANRLLAQIPDTINPGITPYPNNWLPVGIRSRFVDNVYGLRVHVLESGYETPNRPVLLLLHGFPELAYSWRKIMIPLASAGYRVIAPDLLAGVATMTLTSLLSVCLTKYVMPLAWCRRLAIAMSMV